MVYEHNKFVVFYYKTISENSLKRYGKWHTAIVINANFLNLQWIKTIITISAINVIFMTF